MGRRIVPVTAVLTTAVAVASAVLAGPASAVGDGRTARAALAALPDVRIAFAVEDRRITGNERATMSARLMDAVTGDPVPSEDLQLQWQRLGTSGWQTESTKSTDGSGRVEWAQTSTKYSARYRVVHQESVAYAATVSDVRTVTVKPVVSIALRRDWVRPGGLVRLRGDVDRAYPGERVVLQRRSDGGWTDVKRAQQDDQGRFTFSVRGTSTYGPQRYRVVLRELTSRLGAVSETAELTTVRLVTYQIETRGKVKGALDSFRQRSAQIYADSRGWSGAYIHFKRVPSGAAFSLVLSQAKYVPGFAPICDRYWSCRVGRYVVINENRWRYGTPYFKESGGTLREYRAMVVNHETGHWLGLGHATCGGKGQPAPVMMQQSKGLNGCQPNPWPLRWEINRTL